MLPEYWLLGAILAVLLLIQHDLAKARRELATERQAAEARRRAAAIARGPRPTEQRGQAREVGGW